MRSAAIRRLALALPLALAPTLALAHPGHDGASGFAHGFLHPMTGTDHILAMVLVGLFAFQLGGKARLLVPLAFLVMMAAGGALGMAGFALPAVEIGIGLSVVVLGAAVAFNVKVPAALAMAVVGLFAVFHGFAHGAEMPENAAGLSYAAGFLLATALLHAAGLGLGFAVGALGNRRGSSLARVAGGLAAVAGIGLLAS